MAKDGSRFVVIGALSANAAITAVKFAAAAYTGSSAMLSEGIHSAVDTGNQALLLLGQHRSRRPPDDRHPFGYAPELYFWSLIVAVLIFGVGGGMSVYEGITHLRHPSPLTDPNWNYWVLGVAFVLDSASWVIGFRELRRQTRPGEGVWQTISRSKDPAVFTVMFEDSADLAGILLAAGGIYLGHRLGSPVPDGVASLLIGLMLSAVAVWLVAQSKRLIVGEAADPQLVEDVRRLVAAEPTFERADPPLTMHLGPDDVLLNLAVRVRPGVPVEEAARAVDRLEAQIRQRHPDVKRTFVEIDALRPGHDLTASVEPSDAQHAAPTPAAPPEGSGV
jgi:cation diffusion facilitator family transporter